MITEIALFDIIYDFINLLMLKENSLNKRSTIYKALKLISTTALLCENMINKRILVIRIQKTI